MEKKVIARECRFVMHMPSYQYDAVDVHLVKERVHFDDGTSVPHVRFVKDYQIPVYTTKKAYRDHKQKKEWEHIDKLDTVMSTQSKLRDTVARVLGMSWSRDYLKALSVSPYLYGTDMSAATLIKGEALKKGTAIVTEYTVATFDTETDVNYDPAQPIIAATVTMGNKVFTAATKAYVTGISNPEERTAIAMDKYLGDYVKKRNLECETEFVDTEIDIVRRCFEVLHEWKPDFCAMWNMDFDVQKVMEACERANVDPKDILSDPKVPKDRRFFKYKQGPKKQVTASGKVKPINPASQWHTVLCPSSFYFIDSMCVYKQIRSAKQEEINYSLDYILKKVIKFGKLTFKEADKYENEKLRWHQFMQKMYPIEYLIYNRFDCIGMLELDETTKDLASTLPSYSEYSEFSKFSSQPKRLADDLYYECLEQKHVLGTVGGTFDKKPVVEEDDDDDKDDGEEETDGEEEIVDVGETLSLRGWILTLPAHGTVLSSGLCVIEEDPTIRTNFRKNVYDADCIGAYPSATAACNVSKETTLREIITIKGKDEYLFRMQNINLLSGQTNALEYCTTMFNLPTPDKALALYLADKAAKQAKVLELA